MKRLTFILVLCLLAFLIAGCGQASVNSSTESGSVTQDSGYANSATAKMLDAPNKARAAAQAEKDRIKAEQDAIPEQ
jgi:PBP1b-binding outer membrane lipoprotein LpoB